MSQFKKYIILIIISIFGMSCDQDAFFELERPNQFPWSNVKELEYGVNETYYRFNRAPWDNPYGTLAQKNFTESDIAVYLPQFVGGSMSPEQYNRRFTEAPRVREMQDVYIRLYELITACNGPLQMLDEAEEAGEDPFPSITQSDREKVKQFRGELLFMRGVAYWHLARMYAPPYNPNGNNDGRYFTLRREFITSATELKDTYLGSVEEVYNAIEEDLTNAKALLLEDPSSVVSTVNLRSRASRYAASAMLMRLYFIMGEHEKALAECDYIIDSDVYDLNEAPIEAFNKNATNGWGSEVIWQTATDATSGAYGRMESVYSRNHYSADRQSTWASQAMSVWAMQQVGWMAPDLSETEEAQNDLRYQQVYYRYETDPRDASVGPLVWSYKWFRASDPGRSNRPIIRLAEIYLTRSILRFNNNNIDGAAADLNVVRNRAGLENIEAMNLTAEMIHNERIKEMATENGDRTYYLIGLQLPIGIGDRNPAEFSPIMPPYSEYYWLVPEVEMNLNLAY